MTQAAVSYAIRGLEEQLGVSAVPAPPSAVALTEAGERFLADVSLGLSHIHKSAEEMRALAGGTHVTLSASTAFASLWMVPRLQKFRDDLPGIDLRIQTTDRDLDLDAEGIPLGIRGGAPRTGRTMSCAALPPEEIYAVAGPVLYRAVRHAARRRRARQHRLIHLEEPFRPAADWKEWFESAGVNGRRPSRPADQRLCAGDPGGDGRRRLALGWRHLTERLIARAAGAGHRPRHDHRQGFHVAWPKNRELSQNARQVRDWFAAQA